MTALDDLLAAMNAYRSAVPYYIVPPRLAASAREMLGPDLADHVIVSNFLPEGTAYEYRPPAGTDYLARPLPPMCACGRRDGAAPVHTRRADCPR